MKCIYNHQAIMALPAVHDLNDLQSSVTASWESFDLETLNENAVRLRVMEDAAANFHVHETSDELFYVISGTVFIDTEHGSQKVDAGQLLVVKAGLRHRARVEGRATLLVVAS